MPAQDTTQVREKIISILKIRGPSLPVHIAKGTGLSMLFASAFLSELLSEKKIRITNMKVGSSPIYYIPGQEPMLERFSQHLKSKEKDAFVLLRDNRFLLDKEQDPAIRVALRMIRDFAVPFKRGDEIIWRHHTVSESEFRGRVVQEPEVVKKPEQSKEQDLGIFEEEKPKSKVKKTAKKSIKKSVSKTDEKFFNKVKEFLARKGIEILDIENFSKKEIILRINGNQERLLIAYNKKRITEQDIVKAYKKAGEVGLPYIILSLGEPTKKLSGFIDAIKWLGGLEKIK